MSFRATFGETEQVGALGESWGAAPYQPLAPHCPRLAPPPWLAPVGLTPQRRVGQPSLKVRNMPRRRRRPGHPVPATCPQGVATEATGIVHRARARRLSVWGEGPVLSAPAPPGSPCPLTPMRVTPAGVGWASPSAPGWAGWRVSGAITPVPSPPARGAPQEMSLLPGAIDRALCPQVTAPF